MYVFNTKRQGAVLAGIFRLGGDDHIYNYET